MRPDSHERQAIADHSGDVRSSRRYCAVNATNMELGTEGQILKWLFGSRKRPAALSLELTGSSRADGSMLEKVSKWLLRELNKHEINPNASTAST